MTVTLSAPTLTAPLTLGSHGEDVKALQHALNESRLGPPITVDGRFGKATHKALVALQRSKGVKPDGVVGPKTATLLGWRYQAGRVLPYVISFEEPMRPALTPPLQVLLDMILTGMTPVYKLVRDAMFSTPMADGNPRHNAVQIGFLDSQWVGVEIAFERLVKDMPQGALAAAKIRTALKSFIEDASYFAETLQWHSSGGYMWRIRGTIEKVPVDVIVGVVDRVLRGEQAVAIALAQLRMTFDNVNHILDQMPHTDANGVAY